LIPGSVLFQVSGEPPFGNEAILDVLFGLLPGNGYDIADNVRWFEGELPADLLPVAQDPGGNPVCLSIRGPRPGHFWDHNGARFGRDNDESVSPVADGWGAFLGILRRE